MLQQIEYASPQPISSFFAFFNFVLYATFVKEIKKKEL